MNVATACIILGIILLSVGIATVLTEDVRHQAEIMMNKATQSDATKRLVEMGKNPPEIGIEGNDESFWDDVSQLISEGKLPSEAIEIAKQRQYQRLYKPWIDAIKDATPPRGE